MVTLALVAVSARTMAEAAANDGFQALAVDLFGDEDTRRAARLWRPAGAAGTLTLDAEAVLAALHEFARRGDVDGWVAGAGTEGQPDLLAAGARVLPLIGCTAATVARVRDPLAFFGFLSAHGIAHPEVRSSVPPEPAGWLLKDALGCGGWHIRPATAGTGAHQAAHRYFQRQVEGQAMSATFCANGIESRLLGCNQLSVQPLRASPFVYCGAIGPVVLPPAAAQQVGRALRLLTVGFGLQGLGSLDFMLDGDDVLVLEVNPRPPASMALYKGTMAAHLNACLHGALPEPGMARRVSGQQTVWAPRRLQVDESLAARLQAWPGCHDRPPAGARFEAGDPLCTLGALGDSAAEVRAALDQAQAALLQTLETP